MRLKFNELDSIDRQTLKPILVKASKVGALIIGWNPKTAANWRSQKIGPPYYHNDQGSIYYKVDEILEFFTRHQIKTKENSVLIHNNDCETNT